MKTLLILWLALIVIAGAARASPPFQDSPLGPAVAVALSGADVHDASKTTTLPISREIASTYVSEEIKAPWFIDLLNINLNNSDLNVAQRRIDMYMDKFIKEGIRITENLDFG